MQRVWVIPVEQLGGGRMVVAPRTPEALGADAQVDNPTEDGKMAQQARLVEPVALGDDAPTAPAGCARQRAFNGENKVSILGNLGLEYTDIRNIEWDRD